MHKIILLSSLIAINGTLSAADWPTYRGNIARNGETAEELRPPLKHKWTFQPLHAPRCAWGEPNPRPVGGWFHQTEGRRVQFDDTFHVAAANGMILFGSSADGCIYSLDAETGKIRWKFITGGPVRLAPSISNGRVYAGSDDGFVYCLEISDGSVIWKFRAAPGNSQLLGSGQMISRWPIRTGVLVDGGVAYFCAGVFPAEGVFVYAVNAETGALIWCNDKLGAPPQSRFSPQGYMLASKDVLYVPTGRVSPAGLDRKTGKLLYETYFEHAIGGTYALLVDDHIFTGTNELMGYDKDTKSRFAWFQAKQIIVSDDNCYTVDGKQMTALDNKKYPPASLRREELRDRWNREQPKGVKATQAVKEARKLTEKSRKEVIRLENVINKTDTAATEAQNAELKELRSKSAKAESVLKDALNNKEYQSWQALLAEIDSADEAITTAKIWSCQTSCDESLILAGSVLYAGGDGKVTAVDRKDGSRLWDIKVEGRARGLAVTDGKLIISTDTGAILVYSTQETPTPVKVLQPVNKTPWPPDELTPIFEDAAKQILRKTSVTKGYALMLGCGTGRLAYELIKNSGLIIYGLEPDAAKVALARKKLLNAGVLGSRIRIDAIDPNELNNLPYPDYFANLVVSESALTGGGMPGTAAEAFRMTRPLGGTIYIGSLEKAAGTPQNLTSTTLRSWADQSPDLKDADISSVNGGTWLTFKRGALPGAGSWTQEYAEPGNTTCGNDTHLTCPLGVLWYGSPGPAEMAERHTRASAPLSANGRIFIQGEGPGKTVGSSDNVVMCYDAYNGVKHWERSLPGALRMVMSHDGANAVLTDDSYFIITRDGCMRLSAATGKTIMTYKMPVAGDKSLKWGYISVVDGRLYGTGTESKRIGSTLVCVDVDTGRTLWRYNAKRIPQGAISIGDGKIFLSQSNVTPRQRREALSSQYEALEKLTGDKRKAAEEEIKKADVQLIVALDAVTGKTLWTQPMELTGAIGHDYWCSLGSIYKDGVLVLFGVYADGHYWKQFFAGKFNSRRIFALDAANGSPIWAQNIGYRVRPIVIDDTLHAEPWAFDLHTGKQKMRINPVTGREEPWQFARPGHHCGCPAGTENMLLFRSYTLGWYDLKNDFGTQHFGSLRTSCWINFIPANGVLMVPEGGSGCLCAFPTSCTVVFENSDENRSWAYFSTPGPVTPVKHLALNLGAPGDRRAPDGTLWLGYPRPRGALVMTFEAEEKHYSGGSWFCHDPLSLEISGTETPWVARSGLRGARTLELPLIKDGEGSALYTIRMLFAEIDKSAIGQRVFDIKIQGREAAKGVDVVDDAGGQNRVIVKEFKGIHVDNTLNIELVSKIDKPTAEQMPVLQGVEVIREKVLSAGVLLPGFELSDGNPKKQGTIRVANYTAHDLCGTLKFAVPKSFKLSPAEFPLLLAQGKTGPCACKDRPGQGKPGIQLEAFFDTGGAQPRYDQPGHCSNQ